MTDGDITPGDVEGVREQMLDDLDEMIPADYADGSREAYRAAWIDAVITMDRRLTERDDVPEYPYDQTD